MRVGTRPRPLGAAAATAAVVAALATDAARASVDPGIGVRAGHNVSVFAEGDFVAAFGLSAAGTATVEVFRGPHRIARAAGLPREGAIEVNHGTEGPPGPGDCWQHATPDIQPFDRVVVTDADGRDASVVDDLKVIDGPTEQPDGAITLTGHARSALDGAPIDLTRLEGEVRLGAFRTAPDRFDAGAAAGEFVARYVGPYSAGERSSILTGDHAIGFGHAELPDGGLPPDTQIIEVGSLPGPAPGCGDVAPTAARSAATALDDDVVGPASGDLVVSGTAAVGVTRVDVAVSDGSAGGTALSAHTEEISAAPRAPEGADRAWTITVPAEALATLAPDAVLSLTPTFTAGAAAPATGAPLLIPRDAKPPAPPTVSPDPGVHPGPLSVSLHAERNARIFFTTDGTPPTTDSPAYSGSFAVARDTTVRAIAVDAAGNVSEPATARFSIQRPQTAPAVSVLPAPAPVAPPAALGPAPGLHVTSVSVRAARVTLRRARREGMIVRFVAPAGAEYAEARLLRVGPRGARRPVARRVLVATPGRRQAARFTSEAVRGRLLPGRYVLEVRAGEALTRLGAAALAAVRVIR